MPEQPAICSVCHERHTLDPSGICAVCLKTKHLGIDNPLYDTIYRLRVALLIVDLYSRGQMYVDISRYLGLPQALVKDIYQEAMGSFSALCDTDNTI